MTVEFISATDFPTEVMMSHGRFKDATFKMMAFKETTPDGLIIEHAVAVYGELKDKVLGRIHSECLTGDIFRAVNCDCRAQLEYALAEVVQRGSGFIIYMRGHEGRGNGLGNKFKAVGLEETHGLDTVEAHRRLSLPVERRNFTAAAEILKFLGLSEVTLMTNNPIKILPLQQAGLVVHTERVWVGETRFNRGYLNAKRERMGHIPMGTTDEPYYFWDEQNPFANFFPSSIEIGGQVFATLENYYQAQKFTHIPELFDRVANAPTPAEAKALSREHKGSIRDGWIDVREEIMLTATRAKFSQHAPLAEMLLNTGEREIVEDSPDDQYWGKVRDKGGLNRAGIILMQVRAELSSGRLSVEPK